TDRFVQAPFLLEGALQGLAGAALAIAGLIAFQQTLSPQLANLLSFLRLPGSGAGARPWMEALELGLAGAALRLAASYLAVHRFLRAGGQRSSSSPRCSPPRTRGRERASRIRSSPSGRWSGLCAPSRGTPSPRSACTPGWPACRLRARLRSRPRCGCSPAG